MSAARQTAGEIANYIFASMSRCLKCQSTAIDKIRVPGSAIEWFTCQTCSHVWCRVDGEVADPPPPEIPPDSENSPDS